MIARVLFLLACCPTFETILPTSSLRLNCGSEEKKDNVHAASAKAAAIADRLCFCAGRLELLQHSKDACDSFSFAADWSFTRVTRSIHTKSRHINSNGISFHPEILPGTRSRFHLHSSGIEERKSSDKSRQGKWTRTSKWRWKCKCDSICWRNRSYREQWKGGQTRVHGQLVGRAARSRKAA